LTWNINNPNPQYSKAHLTILNLSNVKVIEAMKDKKLLYLGPHEWHYFCNNVYKILPSGAKVISW
jgi:hypothetical protein